MHKYHCMAGETLLLPKLDINQGQLYCDNHQHYCMKINHDVALLSVNGSKKNILLLGQNLAYLNKCRPENDDQQCREDEEG